MNENEGRELQIDLGSVLQNLWKNKILILLVCALCALATFTYFNFFTTKYYRASSEVFILNGSNSDSQTNTTTYNNLLASKQLAADIEDMMTNVTVTERVVNKLGLNMTAGALSSKVSVSTRDDTRIVVISVKDTDPYRAAQIANSIRETSSEKIVSTMELDAMNLISEARVPTAPISNNARRNAVLVFIFVFIVCVGVVTLIDVFNDTIKSADDVERYLGITTLGSIPVVKRDENEEGEE